MSQRDMNPIRPFITPPPEPRRWRIRDVVADTLVCGGLKGVMEAAAQG